MANEQWDEPLDKDSELSENFIKWMQAKNNVINVNVKRHVYDGELQDKVTEVQLVGFCDASPQAYAAVVYLRYFNKLTNKWKVTFMLAKAKVAPLNSEHSLPRLELLSAVKLVGLMVYVRKLLEAEDIRVRRKFYFTDSQVALAWILKDPTTWKVFVANRVRYIQSHTSLHDWFYVDTKNNPADLATRFNANNAWNKKLWWEGPEFLKREYGHWPKY